MVDERLPHRPRQPAVQGAVQQHPHCVTGVDPSRHHVRHAQLDTHTRRMYIDNDERGSFGSDDAYRCTTTHPKCTLPKRHCRYRGCLNNCCRSCAVKDRARHTGKGSHRPRHRLSRSPAPAGRLYSHAEHLLGRCEERWGLAGPAPSAYLPPVSFARLLRNK